MTFLNNANTPGNFKMSHGPRLPALKKIFLR
jgi:hypothetical protein